MSLISASLGGKAPTNLYVGELGVNLYDGKLYAGTIDSNSVVPVQLGVRNLYQTYDLEIANRTNGSRLTWDTSLNKWTHKKLFWKFGESREVSSEEPITNQVATYITQQWKFQYLSNFIYKALDFTYQGQRAFELRRFDTVINSSLIFNGVVPDRACPAFLPEGSGCYILPDKVSSLYDTALNRVVREELGGLNVEPKDNDLLHFVIPNPRGRDLYPLWHSKQLNIALDPSPTLADDLDANKYSYSSNELKLQYITSFPATLDADEYKYFVLDLTGIDVSVSPVINYEVIFPAYDVGVILVEIWHNGSGISDTTDNLVYENGVRLELSNTRDILCYFKIGDTIQLSLFGKNVITNYELY